MDSQQDIQLSDVDTYDTENMIFGKAKEEIIKGLDGRKIGTSKRIQITTKYTDGKTGPFIFKSPPDLFSFGISVNKSPDTGAVTGHTLPICLFSKEGKTPEQDAFYKFLLRIVEQAKTYLVDNREEVGLPDLEMRDLKSFSTGIFIKKDEKTKKPVPDASPVFYVKLIEARKAGKILSQFYDQNDTAINPEDLMGKYCTVQASIKVESIFLGSQKCIQFKVNDAVVNLITPGIKRLLTRKPEAASAEMSEEQPRATKKVVQDEDEDIHDEEVKKAPTPQAEEEDEEAEKPKKVIKKIVKKVPKKPHSDD